MRLAKDYLPLVLEKSFHDFPVPGVDVIDFRGGTRAFVVNANHELWKNSINNKGEFSWPLRRNHHDVYLSAIYGRARLIVHRNIGVHTILKEHDVSFENGFLALEPTGVSEAFDLMDEPIGRLTSVPSDNPYTVYVPQGETAAWFLHIGKETSDQPQRSYTNLDINPLQWKSSPLSMATLIEHLGVLGVELWDPIDSN